MSTTPLKGENAIIFIADNNSWKPIACLTSNSLSTTVDEIERRTKCAPGVVEKSAGDFNYSHSIEGEYIDTTTVGGDTTKQSHDALLSLQMARQLKLWKLDTDITDADSVKYYGKALITDLNADFAAGSALATFSATLSGSGAITLTDPLTPPSI